jgi:flagellar L-ring protein FlgH
MRWQERVTGKVWLTGLVVMLLNGCAQLPSSSVVGDQEQMLIPEPPSPRPNGAIFQAQRGYQPLFEDRRPRMVGEILTIVLDEQVSASKTSVANANRGGSASLGLSELPDALETLAEYGFDLSGDSEFSGGEQFLHRHHHGIRAGGDE